MFAGNTSTWTLPPSDRINDSTKASVSGCAGPSVGGTLFWTRTSCLVMKLD
jgi:hypothetical protein